MNTEFFKHLETKGYNYQIDPPINDDSRVSLSTLALLHVIPYTCFLHGSYNYLLHTQ